MINGQYHEEYLYLGQPVVLDLADLGDCYELMLMNKNNPAIEIACKVINKDMYSALELAVDWYNIFRKRYNESAKPLTGKYARLRDDLKKALKAGIDAEHDNPEDGGSCNFDSASISLYRWNEKLVERAAEEAGTKCFKWNLYGNARYVFNPKTHGQGNARSRNAEAMTKALKVMGYDAMDYSQMD